MTVSDFNRCVEDHADGLYRFILKNIRDKDRAKDIIQDSYEKLWLKVGEIEISNSKSYMFTIAYRTMIDHIRKDKKYVNETQAVLPEIGHEKQYSDLKEILHEAINHLPEIQRSVVMLRDYEGYEYKEIGEITGLSESQVKVYIFRARQFLKSYIGKMEAII